MIIPVEMLDEKTLRAVIEEFVSRDGTEFTDTEQKVLSVKSQLSKGHVVIAFDELSKTCNIVAKDELKNCESN